MEQEKVIQFYQTRIHTTFTESNCHHVSRKDKDENEHGSLNSVCVFYQALVHRSKR